MVQPDARQTSSWISSTPEMIGATEKPRSLSSTPVYTDGFGLRRDEQLFKLERGSWIRTFVVREKK